MKRRDFFKQLGVVAAATSVMPVMSFAEKAEKASKPKGPNDMPYKVAVEAITGGKAVETSSKVTLKVPEIAENGAVVPVTVNVDSPMSESDYVKAIHIIAAKNGNTRCIDVFLTPANGKAMLATRIKLGETQKVVALVELSNGKFITATQSVKVTIGGCG
jgi:sulfur-oxidizing protein SoxY